MQVKFDILEYLPTDPLNETMKQLSSKEVVNFASISTQHLNLFKPLIDKHKLSQFLHHVTHGNHEAVQDMLTGDFSLFYRNGQITDCSGRTFENISGFEYSLWALDKHMWTTIIECLPIDEKSIEVYKLLKGQYDNVNTKGVTYSLNEQTITEKHFDFGNTIIKELQTQVAALNAPGPRNIKAIDKQWREDIGGRQKLLPIHVVDEYCSNEPFDPVPQFTSQPKSDKKFYNRITGKVENWFSPDSKLGIAFAIVKGSAQGCMPSGLGGNWVESSQDLVAMTALYEVRTKDFISLKSLLEEQTSLENHHQIVRI